jgi:hypothetical protein
MYVTTLPHVALAKLAKYQSRNNSAASCCSVMVPPGAGDDGNAATVHTTTASSFFVHCHCCTTWNCCITFIRGLHGGRHIRTVLSHCRLLQTLDLFAPWSQWMPRQWFRVWHGFCNTLQSFFRCEPVALPRPPSILMRCC